MPEPKYLSIVSSKTYENLTNVSTVISTLARLARSGVSIPRVATGDVSPVNLHIQQLVRTTPRLRLEVISAKAYGGEAEADRETIARSCAMILFRARTSTGAASMIVHAINAKLPHLVIEDEPKDAASLSERVAQLLKKA